jgi:hypothetical protein
MSEIKNAETKEKLVAKLEKCPFCHKPGEKVDAHIIPEAFFRDISEEGHVLKQREIGSHPKRMRIGVYDEDLWCKACEEKFRYLDDYAISILRTPVEKFMALHHAYELEIEKPENIKLFFISLLWRASVSNKRLFKQVSIGPYKKLAEQLLESNSAGTFEQFSTIISCSGADEKLIAEPVTVRRSRVKFYRFYLGCFIADIKVDKQPIPRDLEIAVIGHSRILSVLRVQRDMGLVNSASQLAKQLSQSCR